MEIIKKLVLPPTFPPDMVPAETLQFMLTLIDKPLAEALHLADEQGLNPRTGPLAKFPDWFREFSIIDPHMGLIPFGCIVKTSGGPAVH